MKGMYIKKMAACIAAVLIVSAVPVLPISAEETESQVALRIDRVELSPNDVPEDRTVSVNVQVSENQKGFLAAEFGISYDSRLTLKEVHKDIIGDAFQYKCNPEENFIWFSGASSFGSEVASRDKATIVTLDFELPESYSNNDQYLISFDWSKNGKHAFWYTDKRVNDIDALKMNSHNGQIWLPAADSAKLNQQELQMNQGESYQLEVLNSAGGGYWISSDPQVLNVSQTGVVTANKPGVATIYCITSTGQTLSCEVTVTTYFYFVMKANDPDPVNISSSSQVVYLEYPDANATVLWFSDNPNAVTIENGRVKVIGEGEAMITAICNGVALQKKIAVDFSGSAPQETPTETTEETTTEPTEETTEPTEEITEPTEEITEPTEEPTEPTEEITEPTEEITEPPVVIKHGDVNGDNEIDIIDVLQLNKALLGVYTLTPEQRTICDVYTDSSITDRDAMTLLRYIVRLVETIPVLPE